MLLWRTKERTTERKKDTKRKDKNEITKYRNVFGCRMLVVECHLSRRCYVGMPLCLADLAEGWLPSAGARLGDEAPQAHPRSSAGSRNCANRACSQTRVREHPSLNRLKHQQLAP